MGRNWHAVRIVRHDFMVAKKGVDLMPREKVDENADEDENVYPCSL